MNSETHAIPLGRDYLLTPLSEVDFRSILAERSAQYFDASSAYDVHADLTALEHERIDYRSSAFGERDTMYWAIVHRSDIVGWSQWQQTDTDILTMRNTAIDPAHRRKGLYTALLPVVINHARSEGYQRIVSTHHASNNAVIIPKLKAGFIITGLNINEKYGAMITLTYYVYEGRLRCAKERIGHVPRSR